MNNIEIAKETLSIIKRKHYTVSRKKIYLPDIDIEKVVVYSPADGEELLKKDFSGKQGEMCTFSVINKDSFEAAKCFDKPFVMNFANAHRAGGGFELGANAQEETLCRCSTLFASISSAEAKEMYRYNNSHICAVESDYMLLSPEVCVFRDAEGQLMEDNFTAAVITVPAPNRRGAAMFATSKLISETFIRRIRIMLAIAIENGYRNLVLGAWGCGAFGNKPESVAEYFRQVLIDEEYGKCFDNVCFAIYGRTDSRNFTTFNEVFR